jgi:TolB protein
MLAFEKYVDNNLEIYIRAIDDPLNVARITSDPNNDSYPSWSADGAWLAFTSNRTGANDIWFIDVHRLGQPGYEINYTQNPKVDQSQPSFAPSGDQIAWSEVRDGLQSLYIAKISDPAPTARYLGSGSQPSWSPDGQAITVSLINPNKAYFSAIRTNDQSLLMPPIEVEAGIQGLSWGPNGFLPVIPQAITVAALQTPSATWSGDLTPAPGNLFGRQSTIPLPDVVAPHPELNALVIAPFFAIRQRISEEIGWDVLSDLDNLFVPLTEPLEPGYSIDWLHTGRAFALNTSLLDLNWLYVVKEEFGDQIYWRVYVKTLNQDGSQGKPIPQHPWNFYARYSGRPEPYENGGELLGSIPAGYFVDLTELARRYGWERQSAQSNWRSFFPGTHFNIFVIDHGLDWESAMLQLYPPEIFINP